MEFLRDSAKAAGKLFECLPVLIGTIVVLTCMVIVLGTWKAIDIGVWLSQHLAWK